MSQTRTTPGTADISASGPVNGMGESEPAGSYVSVRINTRDSQTIHRIARGAAEGLVADLQGALAGSSHEHDFIETSLHMLRNALPDETRVVGTANASHMVLHVGLPEPRPLMAMARSLIEQAIDLLDDTAVSREDMDLLARLRDALVALPSETEDEDAVTAPPA